MLLVSGRTLDETLGPQVLDSSLCVKDPYQALIEMAKRDFPVVLLDDSGDDLPSLCRAARSLQKNARMMAMCSPSSEPVVAPLAGRELDDYFIFPPSKKDIAKIALAASETVAPAGSAAATSFCGSPARLTMRMCRIVN